MKPGVYIETSVLSALVDERDDPYTAYQRRVREDWWRNHKRFYRGWVSEATILELNRAEFPGREKAVELANSLEWLPITDETWGVAQAYQEHLVMPREDIGDALHLALACVHELEYLLTWNCRHLANPNKTRHLQSINRRLGLLTPILLTPEMLCGENEEEPT
jgi:predicted nucleic acid-binding protein